MLLHNGGSWNAPFWSALVLESTVMWQHRKESWRKEEEIKGSLAHLMVESLCATTMVVRPVLALSRAACTTFSLPVSRADVASSSSRIFGFLTTEHNVSFLGGFFEFFSVSVQYSTLFHLPPLRFHCVGGCWDRTQDRCD